MSAVPPGAFSITSPRYWPSPSWVIPRSTFTPACGTSENLIVLFWPAKTASETSFAHLVGVDVDRHRDVDVVDVIAPHHGVA